MKNGKLQEEVRCLAKKYGFKGVCIILANDGGDLKMATEGLTAIALRESLGLAMYYSHLNESLEFKGGIN